MNRLLFYSSPGLWQQGLLVVAASLGIATGCGTAAQERDPPSTPQGASPKTAAGSLTPVDPTRDSTTSGVPARLVAESRAANPLDADRAMGYLSKIANIGPRYTGSAGMREQREFLVDYFTKAGAKVTEQPFKIRSLQGRGQVDGANLLIEWHPERRDRVLVCAHYDTRPLPDYDPDPRKRQHGVFIGANDGASGVALLMELTHHLESIDSSLGIDFVLFDAEDYVYGSQASQLGEYCLGSQHFAREYRRSGSKEVKYHWGVLVDMVGDAQLEIRQEQNSVSWRDTRPLVQELWRIAAELRVEEFVPRLTKSPITDDHVMLRDVGKIPTCNLIDAMYPDVGFGEPGCYWHTEQDIPANCSGESVAKVGWVVLEWLKRVRVK